MDRLSVRWEGSLFFNFLTRACKRCLWIGVLLFSGGADAGDTYVYIAGDPWPPYFVSSDGMYIDGGAAYAVTKEIFQRVEGLQPVFPVVPWKRALQAMKTGSKDAIPFLFKTRDRERTMLFSIPVAQSQTLFFFSRQRFPEGFSWSSESDLKGLRLGIVAGFSYGAFLDGLIADNKTARFVEVNSSALGFKMLAKGRIDLMPESVPVGKEIIREQGWLDQAGWASHVVNSDVHYLAISKKSPARRYLKQINDAILDATHDGTIDQLLAPVGASAMPYRKRDD